MKENKNIDQFFKDKFENFEVNPPEEIWENIEEKLQKKKKRRVIPFWWFGSGVAALFVIGLFIFNNNYIVEIHPVNDVVIENNTTIKTNSLQEKNIQNQNVIKENTEIATSESDKNNASEETNTETNNVYKESLDSNENSSVVSSEKKSTIINNDYKNSIKKEKNTIQNSNNTIVNNTKSGTKKNNKFLNESDAITKLKITEKENETVEKQENIVQNNSNFNETKSELNKDNNIELGKIAMKNHNSVATKGEVNTSKDSTAIATVETNELEELLKEKETQIAQEQKMNRWQVTPNLAPIYFGSFANGSPLDSNLDENAKSFNTNLSYGVIANYNINKKIKIRTGINSFTVDYNTNDIVFFQSSNARMMKNVNPTNEGSLIEIIPIKNINPLFNKMMTEQNTGVLNQKMGYIEMPMEISYTLIDKKFGVELIGGMSTMFLNKNEVYLEADGINLKIGEASNLNPVHFSTNIGVGLHYALFKNIQARMEPIFKYQINTFSRDSQNFKPYVFGIYSGISYSF